MWRQLTSPTLGSGWSRYPESAETPLIVPVCRVRAEHSQEDSGQRGAEGHRAFECLIPHLGIHAPLRHRPDEPMRKRPRPPADREIVAEGRRAHRVEKRDEEAGRYQIVTGES